MDEQALKEEELPKQSQSQIIIHHSIISNYDTTKNSIYYRPSNHKKLG
jgi:hypothetical protein